MNNHRLIIEPILSLETLKMMVTPSEWSQSEEFASLSRRREWLSWRAHLRAHLFKNPFCGVNGDNLEFAYTQSGAPYIINCDIHISVSHTRTHVAILLGDTPCAIDMELLSRNFSTVSQRYISPTESTFITSPTLQAVAWSAKEAAYKFASIEGCDFLRDIKIQAIQQEKKLSS